MKDNLKTVKIDPSTVRAETSWPYRVSAQGNDGRKYAHVANVLPGTEGEESFLNRLNGNSASMFRDDHAVVVPQVSFETQTRRLPNQVVDPEQFPAWQVSESNGERGNLMQGIYGVWQEADNSKFSL